jgi:hypothetical protein
MSVLSNGALMKAANERMRAALDKGYRDGIDELAKEREAEPVKRSPLADAIHERMNS